MTEKLSRKDKGEKIGGGYFVFRRGSKGRIKVDIEKVISKRWIPFEHPTFSAAIRETEILQTKHPEANFCILQQIYQTKAEKA